MNTAKIKPKLPLPAQYSMSFPDKHAEVLYIPVFIKIHISNDMDKGNYFCDVLGYNTGTWWNFDDDKKSISRISNECIQ